MAASASKNTGGLNAGFQPSVWGDYFVTYVPPNPQRPEEWMRVRLDQLKGQVRRKMVKATNGTLADTVKLVDTLERLGIDKHFRGEIAEILHRVKSDDGAAADGDLNTAALRFRLLRQHGSWVSADVFNKFRDSTGSFSASLCGDSRGLLSLYNAAHLAMPGEDVLDDAIIFSRHHLRSMKDKLKSPLVDQISRALDIPLPRAPRRSETISYIAEYELEEVHDVAVLELARLDFNLVRSLHLKELKTLSLWWRDLYDTVKLSYTRDRFVETHFWSCLLFHDEEYSRARSMVTKVLGLLSLMDDTYDVHATLEESHKLNQAIKRWDESAVSILPEYLRIFYIKLLKNFDEMMDSLEPHEKYRVSYVKEAVKLTSEYYFREAKWSSEKYMPRSVKEHLDVSVMSSGFPMLALVLLMGVSDNAVATKEAFEWGIAIPDVVSASAKACRLRNDIASYKLGKNKKDVASTIECYMEEHGVDGEVAVAAITAQAEHAWRTVNRECMEMDRALLPAAQLIVNLTKTHEVIYLGGRDGYTFGGDIKDLVSALFIDPVPF